MKHVRQLKKKAITENSPQLHKLVVWATRRISVDSELEKWFSSIVAVRCEEANKKKTKQRRRNAFDLLCFMFHRWKLWRFLKNCYVIAARTIQSLLSGNDWTINHEFLLRLLLGFSILGCLEVARLLGRCGDDVSVFNGSFKDQLVTLHY